MGAGGPVRRIERCGSGGRSCRCRTFRALRSFLISRSFGLREVGLRAKHPSVGCETQARQLFGRCVFEALRGHEARARRRIRRGRKFRRLRRFRSGRALQPARCLTGGSPLLFRSFGRASRTGRALRGFPCLDRLHGGFLSAHGATSPRATSAMASDNVIPARRRASKAARSAGSVE